MNNTFGVGFVVAGMVCVSCTHAAQAPQTVEQYNFKVEPGSLNKVVSEIALQARASISLGAADADVSARGVAGVYTLRQALDMALADTGWLVEASSDRALRLVPNNGQQSIAAVVITARRNDFVQTSSSLLTRTDTALRQTPGTLDSVTEEVLESQNAISVFEALRNIPGAMFSTNNGANSVIIGQEIAGDLTYTNGMQGSRVARNPPVTDIETIEVLKGPAAILAGASISSGTINYVPKRATGKNSTDLSMALGSGSERLLSADLGGALSRERGLFWRVAALAQDADRLPNGGNDPRQRVINPMFGYRSDDITFDTSLQYYTKHTPSLAAAEYNPATGSFREYGDRMRHDTGDDVESARLSYNFEKELVSSKAFSLTLRNKGLYQRATYKSQLQFPLAYDLMGMGAMMFGIANVNRDKQLSEYIDLYAKFATGGVSHQFIVAADLSRGDTRRATDQDIAYVQEGDQMPLLGLPLGRPGSLTRYHQTSFIVQDQMSMGEWHALVGLRQTNYKATPYQWSTVGADWIANERAKANNDKLLLNAGLVYDVSKSVSTYFSYSNGFSVPANDLQTSAGTTLAPTTRKQHEIGMKSGLFDDRLTANASVYKFTTDNSAMADLSNPIYYVSGPGLKGKGYELSLAGSISPTLKTIFGYTYSSSERPGGTPAVGVPNRVANLWAVKTFKLQDQQSVDVGLGGNYNSGFTAQSFIDGTYYKIDREYVTLNGSLGYTNGKYTVNAYINNMLDRRNYLPASQIGEVQIDGPRTFRINFRVRY